MQISGKGPAFGKMQMVVGRVGGTKRERETKGQSWGAGDLDQELGLPEPIVLTLGV